MFEDFFTILAKESKKYPDAPDTPAEIIYIFIYSFIWNLLNTYGIKKRKTDFWSSENIEYFHIKIYDIEFFVFF